ncbi:MAG: PAS domain S-box protein [Chitinophagaceae bacterium]|nr:PAS domain S-box protein [Chitinophagaceae bacterium]
MFAATLKEWYYFKIYPFQETLSIYAASIHERKRAEELLKENEEKLRLLIQNSFDIITIVSQKGIILYESDSIESVLGYKPGERVEKNIFKDTLVHPEDKHLKESMFKNALEAPNTDVRAEFRLLHKDGNYINMEAVCINLLNDFRINGIVANYRDITERKLLEKQKDQFIGIASHELKTPVTSIKGYAQILQQLFIESGDQQSVELIKKMDGQIDRLTNLIKELLDVTQISEGQLKLKKDIFNINELISEVVGEMQK